MKTLPPNITTTERPPRKSRSFDAAKGCLKARLEVAYSCKITQDQLIKDWNELTKMFHLPRYEWNYLRGWYDCTVHQWMAKEMVHCFYFWDNNGNKTPVMSKWENMTEEQREFCRQGENKGGGFWWTDKDGGLLIDKPYFVSDDA